MGTILTALVLLVIVAAIILKIRRDKCSGKCAGCCGYGDAAHSGGPASCRENDGCAVL